VSDAIVISDLHLGSENCEAELLVEFLESIHHGHRKTERLILNGDVFDSIDFRRLRKDHWKVLSLLRKMSDDMPIVWLHGNHDGAFENLSQLIGIDVIEEYVLKSGGRSILFFHGHRFDDFIESYPWTTWFADRIYRVLQRIDKTHHIARLAKKNSKIFLRCTEKIEQKAIAYARELGCSTVCCGHTHLAMAKVDGPVSYFNSGSWTERPCHYLTVGDGRIVVHAFDKTRRRIESDAAITLPQFVLGAT